MGEQKSIYVGMAALDAAAVQLSNYDPEIHHPADYALSIAATILGNPRFHRDEGTACISLDIAPSKNA